MARLVLVAALLVFLAVPASAQDPEATAALRVRVYDSGSGLPIPGARIGSAAAVKASDAGLRRAVAVFLGIIAAVYLVGELLALR